MSDGIERSTRDLLREAYQPSADVGGPEGAGDAAYLAQLSLYARTQYAFYLAFETLVVGLAVMIAVALGVVVVRLLDGVDPTTAIAGLGAVVGGAATAFLQKQAGDAKDRYLEAMGLLREA